jgi:hypothetical protein
MRDKIFETSAGLSVTDDTAILQAKDAGSSVSISWGAWLLLVLMVCVFATAATQVLKKKDEKGGGGVDGIKK